MSATPRPDTVTEARDALLIWAHASADPGGSIEAFEDDLDNLIALVRAEAGVSVEALHRDHHPVPYHWSQSGERGTVCAGSLVGLHHRVELWPCDVERAIQTALAARSAGSGSRVERECVCGHGWADHGLTGGCEAEWGTGDGDVFCPCTTPPPHPTRPCPVGGQDGYRTVHAMPGSRRHPHQPTRCLTCHHPIEAINPGPAASGSEGGTDHG